VFGIAGAVAKMFSFSAFHPNWKSINFNFSDLNEETPMVFLALQLQCHKPTKLILLIILMTEESF
jgi:hypothetical protein